MGAPKKSLAESENDVFYDVNQEEEQWRFSLLDGSNAGENLFLEYQRWLESLNPFYQLVYLDQETLE